MNMSLLALIFFVLVMCFATGQFWSKEEREASLIFRFAANLTSFLVGIPSIFLIGIGALKTWLSTSPAIRSEGPRWIVAGVVMLFVGVYLHKWIRSKWLSSSGS